MKRVLAVLGAIVVLAGAAAAGAWFWNERETRDVRGSSTTEFVSTAEPGATTRPDEILRTEPWPLYGYDDARTRYAPDFKLRPPFRRLWTVRAEELVEFPPVVAYGRLYVATTHGRFLAIEAETGKVAWEKEFHRFTAASPAVGGEVVYQPLMNAPGQDRNAAPGYMVAMDADTGRQLWRFKARVIESSPLLRNGVLYFGTFDDKLYAIDAQTGKVRWTVRAGDDVKGGPAYAGGRIFFGAYDGKVYAVDARTGKLEWESGSQGGLGGAGNFYATPAVAYGRVFIGNTDGKIYAFGAGSGNLLWSKSTGGYVYSSAAVFDKTVYVGSYDRRLYALDAATGDERWSFRANGEISGSPTVLDGVVYFSTLERRTYGLDVRTGKRLWTFPDGQYTPVVADEERVYVTGYTRVNAFEPER